MKSHITAQFEGRLSRSSTLVASVLVGAGLLVSHAAWAQTTSAPGAQEASSTATPFGQATGKEDINPLTGRTLSSEALARELTRTKLAAELSETQVKLAKSHADLALATLRQQADENRLKNEIRGNRPELDLSTVVPGLAPLPKANTAAPKSQVKPRASLELRMPQTSSDSESVRPMPVAPSMAAQGVIQIGGEQIQASTLANSSTTTVVAVDTQARAPQSLVGGSSMGVLTQLGLPALSGNAPAAPVIVPGASMDAPQAQ